DWQGEEGEAFHLDIRLDGAESSVKLAMDASVAHIEKDRIGFKCENMDLDTATHLHRLVELNLGDETLLERDLAELIGVKPA
ncbi:MAG: PilZ domain-containing protein, partial [Thioalkalispiraceae bacterium]